MSDSIDNFLKVLHPVKSNQDGDCSHIEWMEMGHGSGIGDWKCKLQEEVYGDILHGGGSENLDYKPCNCSNHKECDLYKKQMSL